MRALAIWMLLAASAAAQDQRNQARQKFEDGRLQFSSGHYQEALALFKESYQLAPYPALLFNIARCHEQLGEFRDALAAYENYLAVNPQDAEARARADEMRERAASEPTRVVEPSPQPKPPPDGLVGIPEHRTPPPPTPVYKKWWLWTAVVGGVAAVTLGVGLGVGLSGADPRRTFPPLSAQ